MLASTVIIGISVANETFLQSTILQIYYFARKFRPLKKVIRNFELHDLTVSAQRPGGGGRGGSLIFANVA